MATGLRWGYRKGWWNILGLQAGVLLVMVLVATGAGALFLASPLAFQMMKWAGAMYLFYLGARQFFARNTALQLNPVSDGSATRLFAEAFVVNISNPKAILFFMAILPQFIDGAKPPWPQYGLCAATLVMIDVIVMNGYTLFASRILRIFQKPRQIRWLNRFFGILFMTASVTLALFHRTG